MRAAVHTAPCADAAPTMQLLCEIFAKAHGEAR